MKRGRHTRTARTEDHVRSQGAGSRLQADRRPHQKPTLLAPGSWTSILQNHGETCFCSLSHQPLVFCYGSFGNLMQICDLTSSTLYYHPHFQIQKQKHQRCSASWLKLHSSCEVELELNPSNDFRTHVPNSWWNRIQGHMINIYSDKKKKKKTLLSEKSTVNTIYLAILLLPFSSSKQ